MGSPYSPWAGVLVNGGKGEYVFSRCCTLVKTRRHPTYQGEQRTYAGMHLQGWHCPWRLPCASMLISSSSSQGGPWQVICSQKTPPELTFNIYHGGSILWRKYMQNISMLITEQIFCAERARNNFFLLLFSCTKLRGTPPPLPVASREGHTELFTLLLYLYFQIVLGINCYWSPDLISINFSNSLI